MSDNELHFKWEWRLQSEPAALWPFFADTNRVNKDTGLFPVQERDRQTNRFLGNARRQLRYRPLPFYYLDYEEEPFEWVFPTRYGVVRRFLNGPVDTFRVRADLQPLPEGGTSLVYQTWVKPRHLLGRLGVALALGYVAPARFGKALAAYDQGAAAQNPLLGAQKARLPAGAEARLQEIEGQLLAQGLPGALLARLITLVRTADDLTLSRLRPYTFADLWGVERRQLLELCLWATRAGLLDFQWEVLCPMCRGAEDRVSAHLGGVSSHAHCSTCNIDFETNFENSVELTFAPNPAIREVARLDYCVAGPEITPHIAMQQLLAAAEERVLTPVLELGRYRLRTMGLSGGQHFRVLGDGRDALDVAISEAGWPAGETALHPRPQLMLRNRTGAEQLVILERTAWSDQALTAAEVLALQRFRDLFSHEALRPGEQIGVGRLTVLFTDLVDSTRMYREIGDAPAFGLVMNHFDVLQQVIDEEEGAIVKTIGDAVMAVFRRPVAAVRAMVKAQQILKEAGAGARPLQLKAAIHTGASIAVTLNERLDYFGTTINVAARLEKFARGNDIILSDNTYTDPEVCQLLQDPYEQFQVTPFDEMLKGFDEECFHLWRVSRTDD